jgi:hypothetical protein
LTETRDVKGTVVKKIVSGKIVTNLGQEARNGREKSKRGMGVTSEYKYRSTSRETEEKNKATKEQARNE